VAAARIQLVIGIIIIKWGQNPAGELKMQPLAKGGGNGWMASLPALKGPFLADSSSANMSSVLYELKPFVKIKMLKRSTM